MNGQPIRWPTEQPKVIVGGYDTATAGSERYLHLGSFVFAVEHGREGGWCFRVGRYFGNPRWSARWRVYA